MKLGEKLRATVRFIGIFMLMALLALLAMPISVHADVHELHFHRSPSDAGSIAPIGTSVNVSSECGAQTSFSATPFNGYTFWSWKCEWDDGKCYYYQPAVTVACSGLHNATAFFLKNSTTGIVAKTADDSMGTVTGTRPWQWGYDGQYFTISAMPKEGYEFDYWDCNGKKNTFGATAEVQMPKINANKVDWDTGTCSGSQNVYTAHFKEKGSDHGFKAVTGNEGGSITAGAFVPYTTWKSSGTATAVATPAEDYDVDCWLDPDGNTVAGSSKQKQINIPYPASPDTSKDLVYTVKFKKTEVTGISAVAVDLSGKIGGGSVSPAYVQWTTSNRDQSITFTANPDKNMAFDKWIIPSGIAYSGSLENTSLSVVMPHDQPSENLTIKAQFKVNTNYRVYTEVASKEDGGMIPGQGGTVTPTVVDPDENLETHPTLTAEPNTGYVFDHWEMEEEGSNVIFETDTTQPKVTIKVPKKDFMPGYSTHIRAVFRPETDKGIWIATSEGGQVDTRYIKWSDESKGKFYTITASPINANYVFDHWEYYYDGKLVQDYSNATSILVQMPQKEITKNIFYTAIFKKKYTINIGVAYEEEGLISPGLGGSVNKSSIVPDDATAKTDSITATPDPSGDYMFDHWEDVDSEGTIEFTSPRTSPNVNISIPAQTGMPGHDVNIRAVFTKKTDVGIWTIAQEGGTASPRHVPWNDQTKNTSITLIATPNAGYAFDKWIRVDRKTSTSTDVGVGKASFSVTMPATMATGEDITYVAVFKKVHAVYTEVASEEDDELHTGRGGTVNPAMVTPSDSSDTQANLTATPDNGYEFDHWEDIDSDGKVTFKTDKSNANAMVVVPKQGDMPDYDIHLRAVFKPVLDDGIWTLALTGGTTSPRYTKWTEQTKGSSFTVTATPDNGYEFDHWKYHNRITGLEVENYSTQASISVKMPEDKMTDDIIYTAVFKKNNEKVKNKEIHVDGKETSITKESFLNKWRTWIDPALKYVRSTIQNMARTHTAEDASVYEGNKNRGYDSGKAASDLKAEIDLNNQFKHTQSFDHPVIMDVSGFSVSEVSGLKTVFVEGTGSITDSETESYVDDKFGELYIGEIVLSGDIYFENEKGERITAELSANSSDATVVMSGIDTANAARWMLVYKDSGENEFIITPITDATSLIRFTLPDQAGGKITLVSVNYR